MNFLKCGLTQIKFVKKQVRDLDLKLILRLKQKILIILYFKGLKNQSKKNLNFLKFNYKKKIRMIYLILLIKEAYGFYLIKK
jgi:hypothetical protein